MEQKNERKRKALWTREEEDKLRNYVLRNGDAQWDTVSSVLNIGKTANSCRSKWHNYLRPGIRLEDFTPQEMLIILNLRFKKNGWSEIVKILPDGRSDNKIKNFWNTRMKKEAKKLNCDVKSQEFLDKMTQILTNMIQATAAPMGDETMVQVISWSLHQELISDLNVATSKPSFDAAADGLDECFSDLSPIWSYD